MSLLDMLSQQLGGDATAQISRQLGTDETTTNKAIAGALPMLIGALARNAAKPEGAGSLAGALERDHDGSVLDDLSGFLKNPEQGSGDGILRHTLGGKRGAVEHQINRASGLESGAVSKLLPMLAPLVMGALGKAQRQGGLDAGGLASMLEGERQAADRSLGQLGGLGALLDSDADGDVDAGDVAKVGMGLLGKLLRRRR